MTTAERAHGALGPALSQPEDAIRVASGKLGWGAGLGVLWRPMRKALAQVLGAVRWRCVCCALMACLCAGCATSKGAQTEATLRERIGPPVPADPLDLVVGAPEAVVVADVQELRSSVLFERIGSYIERAGCVRLADWKKLLSATRRAALAMRAQTDGDQWLLVLAGRYEDSDAQQLLRAALDRSPRSASQGPVARDDSGRFPVTQTSKLAVSLLDSRVIVLGTRAWAHAALASIAQPVAKFSDAPLWRSVGVRLGCAEHRACILSAAHGMSARAFRAGLSSAGATAFGRQIEGVDSVLAVTMGKDVSVLFDAQLGSSELARSAEHELRSWLWQVNLLIRLSGLPAVLDRAKLSTQDAEMLGELTIRRAELDAYDARARALFERAVPGCYGDAHAHD